jgi:hypothetical protein
MPVRAYSTPIEAAGGVFPDVCDEPLSTFVLFKGTAANETCPSIRKVTNVSIVPLVVFVIVKYVAYIWSNIRNSAMGRGKTTQDDDSWFLGNDVFNDSFRGYI